MPNDAAPPPSSVLERFRELLRETEEELTRVLAYEGTAATPPPLTTDEIVRIYEVVLSELTFNAKPIITDLTIIAGDQRGHGEGIAEAICARILEVPAEQKLPALYLLDSIVKNIGQDYVGHFSSRLFEVFTEAYKQVHPSMYRSMHHLFGTWATVFPSSVLRRIDAELQFFQEVNQQSSGMANMRGSESPRPHGIHVNPKYLASVSSGKGASNLKVFGQEPVVGYDDCESDQGEATTSHLGGKRLHSSAYGGRPLLGGDKLLPSLAGPARMREVDDEIGDWRRRHDFENVTLYNHSNGSTHDRTRALIASYGQDTGHKNLNDNPPRIGLPNQNGFDGKMVTRSWKITEEEEFDWQDMNRYVGDRTINDPIQTLDAAHVSLSKHSLGRNDTIQQPDIMNSQGALNTLGRSGSITYPASRGVSSSGRLLSYVDHLRDREAQAGRFSKVHLTGGPLPLQPVSAGFRPPSSQLSSQAAPLFPTYHPQNRIRPHDGFVNLNNRVTNQGLQLFNADTVIKPPNLPITHSGVITSHNPVQLPLSVQHQFPSSQEPQPSIVSSTITSILSYPLTQPFNHGYIAPSYTGVASKPLPGIPSLQPQHFPSTSLPVQGAAPPFPFGTAQLLPFPQSSGPISKHPASAYSGLINSLVAQGLISLTNQNPVKDSLGVEFNHDLLKVRHESAIMALYADLPRQCTTCALRFKNQEGHSKHMDWHVTKNRMSRNRKQNSSRKWFVSIGMWLSGADALGTESAPGFLPAEIVEETQEGELVVPADEDQKTCALCGEPFEDFYSDETDEWMYRGAVYLNAPDGSTKAGIDRSQLGPIVHAKCRSESSPVPPKDFGQEEGSYEGSQRKRMRL